MAGRCEHIIQEELAVTSATHDSNSSNDSDNSGPWSSESTLADFQVLSLRDLFPHAQQFCEVGIIIIPTFQKGSSATQSCCEDGDPGCWLQGLLLTYGGSVRPLSELVLGARISLPGYKA